MILLLLQMIKTSYMTFFLFRVVEMQRICEATATPDVGLDSVWKVPTLSE